MLLVKSAICAGNQNFVAAEAPSGFAGTLQSAPYGKEVTKTSLMVAIEEFRDTPELALEKNAPKAQFSFAYRAGLRGAAAGGVGMGVSGMGSEGLVLGCIEAKFCK